ncbi:MAG: AAA family ATPase [Candidatus Andersenbacteria bacterium]
MHVRSLSLEQFRSYERAEVRFGPALTVLEGRNAAGKTNLLEALWLLSGARSLRASRDDQVVRTGAPSARLVGAFTAGQRARELVLFIERGPTTRKRWRLQRAPATRSPPWQENFRACCFGLTTSTSSRAPAATAAPTSTSSWCGVRVAQAALVRRVEQVLAQRRAALELLQQGGSADLASLDEQLVQEGAALGAIRRALVGALAPVVHAVHAAVAGSATHVDLALTNPADPGGTAQTAAALAASYRAALAELHAQEVASGRNLVGPQRDDLSISIGGRLLRDFGSRGEWRTAVVALKLAELEHLARVRTERPVLLLDDVLSELDQPRRRALEAWLTKQQTILATTDRHELSGTLLADATVLTGGGPRAT